MQRGYPNNQELTQLFSQTISALTLDVNNLKQMLSLQEATTRDFRYHEELVTLERAVDSIEDKVLAMQKMAGQERAALATLDDLFNHTVVQNQLFASMLRDAQTVQDDGQKMLAGKGKQPQQDNENIIDSLRRLTLESNMLSSSVKTQNLRRDSVNHERYTAKLGEAPSLGNVEEAMIRLRPISQNEYISVSKTIRGRITLAVVNDALQGVVNVVREKYSVLQGNHNRQHYRKYWTLHRALEVEEHGTEPWVSEQELRSDCAFFRSGESTARSILAILRTLQRLKQVPARNSEVTYIVLR